MAPPPPRSRRARLHRRLHALLATAWGPGRRGTRILGVELTVPRGVPHPGRDPDALFFLRTVGPMIAPGHRVLDVAAGAGLAAILMARRGAEVVALAGDGRAREALRANAQRAGIEVEEGDATPGTGEAGARGRITLRGVDAPWTDGDAAFDLVLVGTAEADDAVRASLLTALPRLPTLIGERGRVLVPVVRGSGLEAAIEAGLPEDHRVVILARDLAWRPRAQVLCLGFDAEAVRARRHAARDQDAKAAVSRRRWEGA